MSGERIPKDLIERLESVLARLDAMSDPNDDRCGIRAEVKEAVEPYVSSWVKPDVAALLAWAKGEMTLLETAAWFPNSRLGKRKAKE